MTRHFKTLKASSQLPCSYPLSSCIVWSGLVLSCCSQAKSLEWRYKENHEKGFAFLFANFKKYYLPHLFPSFTKLTNLYKPLLGVCVCVCV